MTGNGEQRKPTTPPMRDPALGVEVGYEVQRALMTQDDWGDLIDRALAEYVDG